MLVTTLLACTGGTPVDTEETDLPAPLVFTVASLNAESGGADPGNVAEDTIAPITGESLFAFQEVENNTAAALFAGAAEDDGQDFQYRMGTTGYEDRLVLAWDDARFALLELTALDDINVNGTVRAPLVGHMQERATGVEFLFVVNHLWRTDSAARHEQADRLNTWGAAQTLPIVTIGDFNFDWKADGSSHDEGYDNLIANDVFRWVKPPDPLVRTECSEFYDSLLDFVFVGGGAKDWGASSAILRQEDDYCRGAREPNYSDHRPITATFTIPL